MKVQKSVVSFVSLIITLAAVFGEELPSALVSCSTPPAVSEADLSDVCTWDDLGYKIHGKNGQKTDFECKSFENDLAKDKQYNALKYGYFSKFSYYGKSEYVNKIKSQAGADAAEYELLEGVELEKLLSGTTMMTKDGSIFSKKDEKLYDKDEQKGKLDGHSEGGSTRFDAKIFVKRDAQGNITEVVISYRGTQFKNPRDWLDDAKQAAGGVPDQYKQASELLRTVLASDSFAGAQIVCTGHSLGGGLVTYAMADNDLQGRVTGYTYDAAGLSGRTLDSLRNNVDQVVDASHRIINIRAEKDPVSYVGYHLGGMYQIGVGEDSVLKNHDLDKLIAAMEKVPCEDQSSGNTEKGSNQVCKPGDDPFDSEPESDDKDRNRPASGNVSDGPDNGMVRPKLSPNTRVRRGGGGDTSARIW